MIRLLYGSDSDLLRTLFDPLPTQYYASVVDDVVWGIGTDYRSAVLDGLAQMGDSVEAYAFKLKCYPATEALYQAVLHRGGDVPFALDEHGCLFLLGA